MTITSSQPDSWECRYGKNKIPRLIFVQLKNGSVHVEDGPDDPGVRSHEGTGGRQTYENFSQSPSPWTRDFPELFDLVRLAVQRKLESA